MYNDFNHGIEQFCSRVISCRNCANKVVKCAGPSFFRHSGIVYFGLACQNLNMISG